jgi:hypothetical protein
MSASKPDITIMWEYSYDQAHAVAYETMMWSPAPGDAPVLHVRRVGDTDRWWNMRYRHHLFPTEEACLREALDGYVREIVDAEQRIDLERYTIANNREQIEHIEGMIRAIREKETS